MNTKKLLNALYRKINASLSDKDLLTGKAYAEYAGSVADGITSKYGANTKVVIVADDSEGAMSACTNGDMITVNAWCPSYKDITNVTERHWCVLGRIVHECGHMLWTNFKTMKSGQEKIIREHRLYPKPDGDETELIEYLDKEPGMTDAVKKLWYMFFNCIEDGFIEKLLISKFPGYGQYLAKNREMTEKYLLSYKEQIDKKIDSLTILVNFTLAQAKYGRVKEFEQSELSDKTVQTFFEIRPLIDAAVDEMSSYHRQKKINELFLKVFKIFVDETKDKDQNGQSGQDSGDGSQQTGQQNQQGQTGQNDASNGGNQQSQNNQQSNDRNGQDNNQPQGQSQQGNGQSGQTQSGQSSSEQSSANQQGQQAGTGTGSSLSSAIEKAAQSASQIGKDDTKHDSQTSPKADTQASRSMAATENQPQEKDAGTTETPAQESSTLENIKKNEVQSRVEREIEGQIGNKLSEEAKEISRDKGIHNGIRCDTYRASAQSGEVLYDAEHSYLDTLARRMMKNLLKEIKDRQLGDALDGNYFGNRLDSDNLYRRDKKLYIQDILPEDVPDMEVSIVIDCSGSMGGEKIEVARKTAYTVWKFCQMLKIPVTVIGHNTSGNNVRIFSVADGNSIDGNDGKRIFSLDPGGCNRDGYALRFALNKLLKSQASDKILFVISDGLPNHNSYHDSEGRADIRDAVAKARKEDISVITAGIGESAPDIRKIWCEGVSVKRAATFLELTDMEKLPKSFVRVIKTQLAA